MTASENRYLISNEDDARTRVSPNSTYKIYSALMALDAGIITGTDSAMDWNGEAYPFESWNRDQNLNSAMTNSVNWYFMNLDHRRGWDSTRQVLTSLSYGNMDFSGGPSCFWLESSLKISPLEQVKLLAGIIRTYTALLRQRHGNGSECSLSLLRRHVVALWKNRHRHRRRQEYERLVHRLHGICSRSLFLCGPYQRRRQGDRCQSGRNRTGYSEGVVKTVWGIN